MSHSVTVLLVLTAVCLLQPVSLLNYQPATQFAELKEEVSHLSQSLKMLNNSMQKVLSLNDYILQSQYDTQLTKLLIDLHTGYYTPLMKKKPVMFYALIRGKTFTYNIDTILVFETVIVDEGGHYNKYDGVFVAPRKGTYMFSWTVSGTGATYTVTELVVENKVISSAGEYHGGAGYSSGSMTALCEMEIGDHAWIRTTGVATDHNLYSHDNYPQSSFLGLLLLNK